MTVEPRLRRSRRSAVVLGWATCALALVAGCGDDANGSIDGTPAPTATSRPAAGSTMPATSATAPIANSSDPSDPTANGLAGFRGELIVDRQRDLLDRGLINVLTHNETGHTIHVTDRQLLSDVFLSEPAEPRRSMLQDGRDVAIQVPYGTTTDCTSTDPVDAAFRFTFTLDDDTTVHTTTVDLGGTEILDDIRAKQCAASEFDEVTDVTFEDVRRTGDRVDAVLRISPRSDEPRLVVERATGTILMGVELAPGAAPVTVTGGATAIGVSFLVNRCDPHALAEVTKRYGLDLHLRIDGRPTQPVPVDVTDLVDELEAAVEHCRTEQAD